MCNLSISARFSFPTALIWQTSLSTHYFSFCLPLVSEFVLELCLQGGFSREVGVVWAKLFTPPTLEPAKIKPQQLPPLTRVPHPKASNQQQQPVIYGSDHKQLRSENGKIMDETVFST